MRRVTLMRGVVLANVASALIALPGALPAQAPDGGPCPSANSAPSVVPPNVDLKAATEFGYGIFQQKCLNLPRQAGVREGAAAQRRYFSTRPSASTSRSPRASWRPSSARS